MHELRTNKRPNTRQSVAFITDGIIDTGDPDKDVERIEDLTGECVDLGIRIFGVAVTEKADFYLIQSLAVKIGGAYFKVLNTDIQGAITQITKLRIMQE